MSSQSANYGCRYTFIEKSASALNGIPVNDGDGVCEAFDGGNDAQDDKMV